MDKQKINVRIAFTPWWVRLAVYVAVGVFGLVLTLLGLVEPSTVDGWLAHTGGLSAFICGLLASTHTGRSSDKKVEEVQAAPTAAPTPVESSLPVHGLPTSAGDTYAD